MAFSIRLLKCTTPYHVLPQTWSFFSIKTGPPATSHVEKWSPSVNNFVVLVFLKPRLANLPSLPGQESSTCHMTRPKLILLYVLRKARGYRGAIKMRKSMQFRHCHCSLGLGSQLVRQDVVCGTILRVQPQWLVPVMTPPGEIAGR